jgi:hypothetical protein
MTLGIKRAQFESLRSDERGTLAFYIVELIADLENVTTFLQGRQAGSESLALSIAAREHLEKLVATLRDTNV